jgi:CheY-like chemotaxis protein
MNNLIKADVSILMVEDNPRYLAELQEWLKELGYQHFATAENIEQAKERLNQHFDVIIADMRLGQQTDSGFEVLDEVQRRKITSIVLILTANDTSADCRRAFRAGAFDYISKNMKGNVFEEVDRSVQDAMRYINRWGNQHDEAWIQENKEQLLRNYLRKYIAVINNSVIESADTEEALKQQIQERKLPLFLPVIRKMTIEMPHGVSVAELLKWKDREDNLVEFKSTLEWDVKENKKNSELIFSTLKSLAAFLNSEGGTLVIGVEDDKNMALWYLTG